MPFPASVQELVEFLDHLPLGFGYPTCHRRPPNLGQGIVRDTFGVPEQVQVRADDRVRVHQHFGHAVPLGPNGLLFELRKGLFDRPLGV